MADTIIDRLKHAFAGAITGVTVSFLFGVSKYCCWHRVGIGASLTGAASITMDLPMALLCMGLVLSVPTIFMYGVARSNLVKEHKWAFSVPMLSCFFLTL